MAGLTLAQVQTAIATYGPILRLHPNEQYKMCSVEYFLARSTLHDSQTGQDVLHPTIDQLPTGDSGDGRYWLNVEQGALAGDMSTAKAYVHAFWDQTQTHTDLQFWFFYAYNGPGKALVHGLVLNQAAHTDDVDLSPMGEHFGDWECCILRIDNVSQQLVGAYLTQHSGGQYFSNDPAGPLQFVGHQLVVYSSRNGHAVYPSAAIDPTEYHRFPPSSTAPLTLIGMDFVLRNDTADGGDHLDCSQNYQIVSADWLGVQPPTWVNYPYRWGPEGTTTRLSPGTVSQVLAAAMGPFANFLPSASLIQFAGILLPIVVTDDVNGPAAPKTKDTWKGVFSTQVPPIIRASAPAPPVADGPDLMLLQITIDSQLFSPLPSDNYGGVSAICAVVAPQTWAFAFVDPSDPDKGVVMSENGRFLTTRLVGIPYSNQSLTFSGDVADAAALMPESDEEDGVFILRLLSDNTVLTVDTRGYVLQFQALQDVDTHPHYQRFVLPN